MEIVLTGITAPVWVLLCLIVAVMIVLFDGRPIFFIQKRIGRNEKLFDLLKFRTMEVTNQPGLRTSGASITPVGKILRKTSLDELPSLLNIVKGEMSLVGPRALPADYLVRFNRHQRKRHYVKPGLTGWAQIQGRNAISWEKRLKYDIWYVENRNLWLDISILLKTIPVVISMKGVEADREQTMPVFEGTHDR